MPVGSLSDEKLDDFVANKLPKTLEEMPQVAAATVEKLTPVGLTTPSLLLGMYLYECNSDAGQFASALLGKAPGLSEGKRAEIIAALIEGWANKRID